MTTVFLLDADPIRRARLRQTLQRAGVTVLGEAATTDALLLDDRPGPIPDVLLLDRSAAPDTLDAVAALYRRAGAVVVLGPTTGAESAGVLRAGAAGVLPRPASPEELLPALPTVRAGRVVLSRADLTSVVEHLARRRGGTVVRGPEPPVRLTDREWEVLEHLALGRSTADIARRMYVSPVTVRSHIASAVRKLGVADRREAVRAVAGAS